MWFCAGLIKGLIAGVSVRTLEKKLIGTNQGLEALRSQLGGRFRGRRPNGVGKLVRKVRTDVTVA